MAKCIYVKNLIYRLDHPKWQFTIFDHTIGHHNVPNWKSQTNIVQLWKDPVPDLSLAFVFRIAAQCLVQYHLI